jgi:hypothetical protein
MGVISEDFENLVDDGAADTDDAFGESAVSPRLTGSGAGRAQSRWRSVEEYREWKFLKAQLDDELDVDADILY